MAVRLHASRADVGGNLPVFERLAPAPSPALLAARIEAHTGPGDIVADLAGRGGWVARAALDRQRRAVSIESSPLTRMLAEDEFTWSADDGTARAILRHYRCTVCRDQRGGSEQRQAPLEPDDVIR